MLTSVPGNCRVRIFPLTMALELVMMDPTGPGDDGLDVAAHKFCEILGLDTAATPLPSSMVVHPADSKDEKTLNLKQRFGEKFLHILNWNGRDRVNQQWLGSMDGAELLGKLSTQLNHLGHINKMASSIIFAASIVNGAQTNTLKALLRYLATCRHALLTPPYSSTSAHTVRKIQQVCFAAKASPCNILTVNPHAATNYVKSLLLAVCARTK